MSEQKDPVSLTSYAVFDWPSFSEEMHILMLISRLVGKFTNIERRSLSCVQNIYLDSKLVSTELLKWFSTFAGVVHKVGRAFSLLGELLLFCSINWEYITDKSITVFNLVVPQVKSTYEPTY